MAKEKVASAAKIEKLVDRQIKKIVEEKMKDDCVADSFGDEEGTSDDAAEVAAEQDAKLEEALGFDIFDYCDKRQEEKKDSIQYTIYKNGELLVTRHHPCSWEVIRKTYGPGSYQVKARSLVTKQYVKHQSQAISGDEEVQYKFGGGREDAPPAQPVQPQINPMEMFRAMTDISEKSKSEAREMAKEQAGSMASIMTVFSTMMQSQAQQSQTMFMELAKMQMATAEKMSETTSRLFEKMDTRFEKLVEKLAETPKKKEDSLSMFEVMKLMEDSQKKGYDQFSKISDLAEEKVEERMALIEETKGSGGRGEKTSMVEKLIEGVMPVLAKSMEASNNQIQNQARGVLPQPQQRPYHPQAARSGQRTFSTPPQTGGQGAAAPYQANSNPMGGDRRNDINQTNVITNDLGLATVKFPDKKVEVLTKQTIEDFLVPTIATALLAAETPEAGKERIIKVLQEKNISVQLFLETFTKEDAKQIVEKYTLPQEAVAWFESVYANIEASA